MGTVEVWTRLDGADGRLTEIYVRQDDWNTGEHSRAGATEGGPLFSCVCSIRVACNGFVGVEAWKVLVAIFCGDCQSFRFG